MASQFFDFIRSLGYEPKSDLIAGKFIRFGRKDSVAAKLFEDGLGGVVHDWRTGEKHYWFANKDGLSPAEYAKRKQESELLKQAQQAKQSLVYADTSRRAEKLFSEANIASKDHP